MQILCLVLYKHIMNHSTIDRRSNIAWFAHNNSMDKLDDRKLNVGACKQAKIRSRILQRIKPIILALIGGIVGVINGLLGGGGGSLVVPLLQGVGGLPEKNAHASAILAILPLSIVSGVIYAGRGNFPMKSGLLITVGVVIGGALGAVMLKKINTKLLTLVFYGIMVYSGIKMLL